MKLLLLIFGIFVPALSVHAQGNFTITGLVTDLRSGQPLAYCSVALFKALDSVSVNGLLANESGRFVFESVPSGKYYIVAQYIGYSKSVVALPEMSPGKPVVDLPTIVLEPDVRTLQELNVTAERQTVENKIDRQVYRADKFLNSQGGTAIDVLRNTPSVTVNSEGEITLRGSSGFLVLVNGNPVQADAATILNQIPANTIENVEVITSPSARFDPDGKAGIINISTKTAQPGRRSFSAGIMGGLPAVYTYSNLHHPLRFGADATFNARSEKWDFSASANYLRNDIAGRRIGDVHTTIGNVLTTFPSEGERSFIRYNYTARAAVSFTPSSRHVFSAGFYKGFRSQSRRADIVYNNTKTDLLTGKTIGQITYFNSNVAEKSGDIMLGNLDYTHFFANKSALTLSGLFEKADLDGLTTNQNLSLPGRQEILQSSRNPSKNPLNAWRLRADYTLNLGKGKLETGYQFRNQDQKGNFQYLDLDMKSGLFQIVPEFSSNTEVVNHIHSVYSQYAAKSGKLEYIAGFRYEYATRAFTAGSAPVRNLDLSNLFPTLNVQYQFSKSFRAKAGYSKRVQRSTNSELNPFPEREHSETLESGDPNVLPEFIDLSEVGITKDFSKGSVFATVYNQRIKNVVNRVNSVYNDTILNRIYTNAGLATSWGLEAGSTLNIAKWWQFYAGANVYQYRIKGSLFNQDVQVNTASLVYTVNANTTFRISSSFQLQGSYNYLSRRVTAQGEDSRFITPGISARKTFLNGKLAATLQWQNIDLGWLGTNKQQITTSGSDFFTTTNYIQETDIFQLNLVFNLNQTSRKSKLPASEFGEKEF
ncbi:TonB-dependent receptor domain-containing protein [Dyadobacter sediminis]|uniref:TonB-dependent receptor n=1 Tax=Dyadobacter sediminis TaxID=1493691 RepID=A0A5R9KKB0_9BACT|nr:TonB-dependent receptor [Dyadobacter sediminis]TLU96653.1 TonB-dependent receptor [Dyadobacter sediminis]GGB84051.1 TonB-dependent receptor [Dyadobacter sediminis]